MKWLFIVPNSNIAHGILFWLILLAGPIFIGCKKPDHLSFPGNDPSKFSSDVIDKWVTIQIRLEREATGIPNQVFLRYYAYSGIEALEALAPGTDLSLSTRGK